MAECLELLNTQLENHLKDLNNMICDKEAKRRLLLAEIHQDPNYNELEKQRTSLNNQRQLNNEKLLACTKEMHQLDSKIDRQKAVLTSTNENRIDMIVKRLETDLNRNSYPLSDEKRIVAEIDALKRSKKELSIFNCFKKQREDKRALKDSLRKEGERLDAVFRCLRKEEDAFKTKGRLSRQTSENLSKEISDLQEQVQETIKQLVSIKEGNYVPPITTATDAKKELQLTLSDSKKGHDLTLLEAKKELKNLPIFDNAKKLRPPRVSDLRPPYRKQKSEVISRKVIMSSQGERPAKLDIVTSQPNNRCPELRLCLALLAYLQKLVAASPSTLVESASSSVYTTPAATPTDLIHFHPPDEDKLLKNRKKKKVPTATLR